MIQTALKIARRRKKGDALMILDTAPWLRRTAPQNLLCGKCRTVLLEGVTVREARASFRTPGRFLLQCVCGALNICPSRFAATGEGCANPRDLPLGPGFVVTEATGGRC